MSADIVQEEGRPNDLKMQDAGRGGPRPVAEVVASSTGAFEAEVYRGTDAPAFGSWIRMTRSDGIVVYALVSRIEVASIDPGRRATALGLTRDELRREMPHVFDLLRTTISAVILAYGEKGVLRQTLPPHPPDLHDFVYSISHNELRALGAPYDYLRTIARNADPLVAVDDLLVAAIRQIDKAHGGGREGEREVIAAGRVLGRLLNEDHERLQSILRRVQ